MRVVMEKISDCKECPYNQIQFNINYSPINICKKFKSNKKENTDGKEIKNTDLKNRKIPRWCPLISIHKDDRLIIIPYNLFGKKSQFIDKVQYDLEDY